MHPQPLAEILLPVPLQKRFTYLLPEHIAPLAAVGQRVLVEFGVRKLYTGIITALSEGDAQGLKPVLELLEVQPSVQPWQIDFWQWMADYYLCAPGEVMTAALPSGLKLSSSSRIQRNPAFDEAQAPLSEKERRLLACLQGEEEITYEQSAQVLGVKSPHPVLKSLLDKQAILLFEKVKDKYQPKTQRQLRLHPTFLADAQGLDLLFKSLEGKPKQQEVLLKYLSMVPVLQDPQANEGGIGKRELLEGGHTPISTSSVSTLVRNQVLQEFELEVSRLQTYGKEVEPAHPLSEQQQQVHQQILEQFSAKAVVLLHGVTGSGKTEVYIRLLEQALQNGGQVLLLLPEIALTTQIVARMQRVFGDLLGVYHSRFSDNERVEVWKGVLSGRIRMVVGVRSSVFLPFDQLDLVIVDEEHEPSYKQYDPAPRYHARDMAIVLAQRFGCKVLLGSATPSVESYYLGTQGTYGLVHLLQRHGQVPMPAIKLVDLRQQRAAKSMQQDFSAPMLEQLQQTLEGQQQAILFQNRRGYAPYLCCEDCGWIPTCPHCAVSLTYHLHRHELRCHYCGHHETPTGICMSCGSSKMEGVGSGTQRLEDDLKTLLPQARVARMDLDATRSKHSYQQLLDDFEERRIDVLVGTQMVTKGLDFEHVQLVGVFDIDRMLHYPDFRANERVFQTLSQVSGRAGRKHGQGTVLIQTSEPRNPLFFRVQQHDYQGFFRQEIQERQQYFYPPFTRLIRLSVRSEREEESLRAAQLLGSWLERSLGEQRVLGPQAPLVNRIRNQYLSDLLVKFERQRSSPAKVKALVAQCLQQLRQQYPKVYVVADVDPV